MNKTKTPFHIIAKPIGPLCNLRCDYCFYLTKEAMFNEAARKDWEMSDEVLEAYTRGYIESQPDGTGEVNFAWQGGEPTLLGIDFFKRALAFQRKYVREGMSITNSIQTNTTLIDDDWAEFLKENDFLVGVSIDGPEKLHDKYRKDAAGKGSFAMVMKGLESLKKHNVDFNTLTVVQDDNSRYPEEVYDFLKSIGSEYIQFIPIVEPLPGGGVSSRTVPAERWGSFMINVFRRWAAKDIGRIFVQHFDMILGIYMGYPSSLCVHSETCGKAMAIEHNGNLYSCDHFVFPENELGNVLENSVAEMVESPFQTKFGNSKRDALPDLCTSCDYLRLCWGGCLKDRTIRKSPGNLNYICKGYYEFYDFTRPYMTAMAGALKNSMPASEFRQFLPPSSSFKPGRNDPCPCLSGKKYKQCCGRK